MKGSKMNLAFGLETIYEDAEFLLGDRDKITHTRRQSLPPGGN